MGSWPVGRKWCDLQMLFLKKIEAISSKLGAQKHQICDHFFATSALKCRIDKQKC